jgi:1-deoxy-D-xylulose-5-phosphate reductoisomerase
LFLNGDIRFLQIEEFIERVMDKHVVITAPDLETILHVDAITRKAVQNMVK